MMLSHDLIINAEDVTENHIIEYDLLILSGMNGRIESQSWHQRSDRDPQTDQRYSSHKCWRYNVSSS